jgi:hypothetical protein
MAGQIGLPEASMLLGRTLADEEIADTTLTQIARELLSQSASSTQARDAEPSREQATRSSSSATGKRGSKASKAKSH